MSRCFLNSGTLIVIMTLQYMWRETGFARVRERRLLSQLNSHDTFSLGRVQEGGEETGGDPAKPDGNDGEHRRSHRRHPLQPLSKVIFIF
jgi:hypothetical protein